MTVAPLHRTRTEDENRHRQRFRKAACVHGHLYTEQNSLFTKQGKRVCLTCLILRGRRSPKLMPA